MLEIRKCTDKDREDVSEIARLTWEGYDYLMKVFGEWIDDGGFYVAELDGRVIGTVKLSILPEKTAWLEGLRVHPDFQGKGVGWKLNDFIIEHAMDLRKSGKIKDIEFATYYKNEGSLHMTRKIGFKVVRSFYILYREKKGEKKEPVKADIAYDEIKDYCDYIPIGWKFLKNTEKGFDWLKTKSSVYSTGNYKFYIAGNEETIIPLCGSREAINNYIPYLNYISTDDESYDIMIPEHWGETVKFLKENDFLFWEKPEEKNILILRY